MPPSSKITALVAGAFLLMPGSALAAHHRHHAHHSSTPPEPTIVVPHKYDAGGDGGEPTTPPGVSVQLFDPVAVAQGLGNPVLGQLGLPPLPTV